MKRTVVACLACSVVAVCLSNSTPVKAIDFGPEETVQAGGVEIQVPGYSVPSFVDWNNDQMKDLIVGEGGGSGDGKVRVYLNVGSEAEPQFDSFFYAQADGGDLACPAAGCMGCFPRVLDWDEDGRKDLLVGQSDGTIRVFLNVADDKEPAFDGGTLLKVGIEGMWTLDVGSRATPMPVDWNSDGMLDLVVGALDGAIHIYLNCGCEGMAPPTFYFSPLDGEFAPEDGRDLLVPGLRSSPVVMDFDGDGRKDLLTGNTDGLLLFYRNVGVESLPMFAGYSLVTSVGEPIDLTGAPRSRPFVCTWTDDGYWDLLVGSGDGKIRLYQGVPAVGDFDLDGDIDLDDLRIFMDAWRQPEPPVDSIADLNADGVLDTTDLEAFIDLLLDANPAE
jgi:WD40 repeat protein